MTATRPAPATQRSHVVRSLRSRWRTLMILGMNVLILIVVSGAVLIFLLEERGAVNHLQKSTARQIHAALEQRIMQTQQTLIYAGELAADERRTRAVLNQLLAAQPALREIAIVNENGEEVAYAPAVDERTVPDWTAAPVYSALQEPGRTFYTALVDGDQPVLVLGVPLSDGLLVAQADPQQVWEETLSVTVGENGHAYVLSDSGVLIAAGPAIAARSNPAGFAVVADSRDGSAVTRLYRGLQDDWVVGRAETFPAEGYTIVVETPLSDYVPLAVRIVALVALALITTGIAGEWLIRRILHTIVSPLERLHAGARAVTAGDFGYRVRVPPHTDRELIELADTFNRMIDRLAESQRQLNAYTNEMQEIIDLRARELTRKAGQLEIASDVSATLGAILDPRPLMDTVARVIRERFQLYHAEVLLLDSNTGKIVSGDARRQVTLPELTIRDAANSAIAWVARNGATLYVADTFIEQRYQRTPDLPASQSELAIPLKFEERVIGVLNLEADHRDAFQKDDIAVLEALARTISVALHNAQAVKALEDSNRDLAQGTLHANQANYLKSRFLYNASQRLRAPLENIVASAEIMPTSGLPEATLEQRRQILHQGRAMQALVEDMIDLSAVEAGHLQLNLQWIKLTPLLDEVMNAARALHQAVYADRDLTLSLDLLHLTEPLPPVWADLDRLRYILMNLVSNAVKFSESGQVVLTADFDAHSVYIRVRDTGPGITDEQRRYLFEPFQHQRGKPTTEEKGTGLGLPVSRLLAMRHGGDLTVKSVLHEGSLFTLNLPRHPDGAPPPPER